LDESDIDSIKMFKLKMKHGLTRETMRDFQYLYRDKFNIDSEWKTLRRMSDLSQIEPAWYDCCIRSCMAFTGKHSKLQQCLHCHEDRYDAYGKYRRRFGYLPVIPRLHGLFQSKKMVSLMSYRYNYPISTDSISDVFDSSGYRDLLNRQVIADGVKLPHTYFSGEHDIAFSFYSDSYQVFRRKRRGPSATPLLLKNLNLPPELRTRSEYLIPLGLIPGTPKDLGSFVEPFQDELVALAHGVETYCSTSQSPITLRAYCHLNEGDIRALEKALRISGVNSFSPCRECEIKGIRDCSCPQNHYYYPLAQPSLDDNGDPLLNKNGDPIVHEWPPHNLPYRSHESFSAVVNEMAEASTTKKSNQIRFFHGIKDIPVFSRVECQHYGRSSAHDWMHMFENIIPNLVSLWTGKFKGIRGDYELEASVWEQVGEETVNAVKDIPATFVRRLPNIATDRSSYTAESWVFWFMYLMPILLQNRFNNSVYYDHACHLRDIMVVSLQFTITLDEIEQMRRDIIKWIREYERRLAVCTLTIHILIHLPDDIIFCGPAWSTWAFYGERFCGTLQRQVGSRSAPYANLTNRLIYSAYLFQITCRFDLSDILAFPDDLDDFEEDDAGVVSGERQYAGCILSEDPCSVLRPPHSSSSIITSNEYHRIVNYLKEVTGKSERSIKHSLPIISFTETWGKVRITPRGDSFRTTQILGRNQNARNNSGVRYNSQVWDHGQQQYRPQLFYGELDKIIVCNIPDDASWGALQGTTKLLALITPWKTPRGKDAAEGVVEFSMKAAQIATDLQSISAVVGKVKTRKRYGIIDRSSASTSTTF
ncbi:hypothetical protein C8J55DRAFT_375496, partial [Lentinula edodes]